MFASSPHYASVARAAWVPLLEEEFHVLSVTFRGPQEKGASSSTWMAKGSFGRPFSIIGRLLRDEVERVRGRSWGLVLVSI